MTAFTLSLSITVLCLFFLQNDEGRFLIQASKAPSNNKARVAKRPVSSSLSSLTAPLAKLVPFSTTHSSKSSYTPLVFFTFPKGHSAPADELETIVSKYEKDMGVTVHRFDILRDRNAKVLYDLLQETVVEPLESQPSFFFSRISSSVPTPSGEDGSSSSTAAGQGHPYNSVYSKKKRLLGPLLYHRNSRQVIQDVATARNSLKMRSWIKGRLLFLTEDGSGDVDTKVSKKDEGGEYNQFTSGEGQVGGEGEDDDGSNVWIDEGLTELQQQGKQRMMERSHNRKRE